MQNLNVVVGDRMVRVEFPASQKDGWVFNDEFIYFQSWKQCCVYGRIYADYTFLENTCSPEIHRHKMSASQLFTHRFGVAPTIVKDRVNRAMYKAFGLNKYVVFCLFQRPGKFAAGYTKIVRNLQQCKEHADRAAQDGLPHLIPLIVATGLSPHDLKTLVGKGAWKRLAANSFSRNKILCHKLIMAQRHVVYSNAYIGDLLSLLNQFPTTVLTELPPDQHLQTLEALQHQCSNRVGTLKQWADKIWQNFYATTIDDTVAMCNQLRRPFNPRWSEKRIQEEHDLCSRLIMQRTYSHECFSWLKEPQEVEHEGYKAELLRSPIEIAMEGSRMHHCVASYAGRVELEQYLIYRLMCGDTHIGTIGVSVTPYVHIDQIQGPCNSPVEVPDEFKHKILSKAEKLCKETENVKTYHVSA